MSSIFLFRTLQVLLSPATNLLAPANTIHCCGFLACQQAPGEKHPAKKYVCVRRLTKRADERETGEFGEGCDRGGTGSRFVRAHRSLFVG